MQDIKPGQTWVTISGEALYVEILEVDTVESSSYESGYELSVGYNFRGGIYYRPFEHFTKRYMFSSGD
jgi:hypothetical protein